MKKVAIYARVSTADQSADSQITSLIDYATRRNFQIYGEYVDQVTGVVSKRKAGQAPAYQRMMADARQKRFDVVLVWKFDRFARSLQALIEALQLFGALGIDFISATQEIDTTTAHGRLFFHIVGGFAEFEREMIVERVRAGISNARKKGVRLGRPKLSAPIDEMKILDLHKQGLSHTEIAKMMNRSRAGVWLVIQRLGMGLASPQAASSNEGSALDREGL